MRKQDVCKQSILYSRFTGLELVEKGKRMKVRDRFPLSTRKKKKRGRAPLHSLTPSSCV